MLKSFEEKIKVTCDPANNRYDVIFDGKIYNFLDLRNRLISLGVKIDTDSEEELLLALYHLEREKMLDQLRGMFAFVIYDHHEKEIFAARDPFGMKSIYYIETEDGVIFSLTKKELLQKQPRVVSSKALHHYLTFQYVPEDESLLGQIQLIKPGHYMIKKEGEAPTLFQYKDLDFQPDSNQSFESYLKQTRKVLEDSVEKHLCGHASIGAYLSGGVDSTCIVALAKQFQPSIQTFTVGFEREGYNEIDQALETAYYLGVKNIQKVITAAEVMDELPRIVSYMDDPIADPAAIPNYFLAKEASKYVKVVLSGEGADELFAGYNIYREPLALKVFDYFPEILKRALNHLAQIFPEGMKGKSYLLRGTTPLSERYVGNAKIFDEREKKALLVDYHESYHFTNMTRPLYQAAAHYDATTQMQYIDLHTWLQGDILAVANQMTKPHALEVRMPFLDRDVYHVARSIPTDAKIAHGTTKYVLRQAMKDIIPEAVTGRKKLGFPVPVRHWLKNEMYDWAILIIENSPVDHLLNKQEIRKLLDQHVMGKHDHSRKIWTILVFMIWYDIHISRENEELQDDKQ